MPAPHPIDLESLIAANVPSIDHEQRDRLLFETGRVAGQLAGKRRAMKQIFSTATASCALTWIIAAFVLPATRELRRHPEVGSLSATADHNTISPIDRSLIADANSTPGFPSTSNGFRANSQDILTPTSWHLVRETSQMSSFGTFEFDARPADDAFNEPLGLFEPSILGPMSVRDVL